MLGIGDGEVTIIIPTLNEEEGIGPTLDDLKENLTSFHIVVIDGRSDDGTLEIAKEMGAEILIQDGVGKGRAISQVLTRVNSETRYIVITDGDFTYPAEYVPKMLDILVNNPSVGMVIGNRFTDTSSLEDSMKYINYYGNRIIALIHRFVNGVNLQDPLTGLRAIRWDVLKHWTPMSEGFDIEVELNHFIHKKGYQIIEIPIRYRQRLGETKLGWRHGLVILRRIVLQTLT